MNRLAALLLVVPMVFAQAQDGSSAFAETPPDESTPFFVSGGLRAEEVLKTELRNSPSTGYPRVKKGPDSTFGQIGSFFSGLIPPIHLGGSPQASESASLAVNPQDPVLQNQRELGVTYTVWNNSNEMTRFEFSTTQHIEILARNASGGVVERWSDDRGFQSEEGIVVINPRERIEYQEKISTREMRAGQAYSVEAALKTQPDHSVSQPVNAR
jgi:hypothetical protein